MQRGLLGFVLTAALAASLWAVARPVPASANHTLGYHWARTANPFTLQLGDNVSSDWDSYLGLASSDWTQSTVLDTVIVPGTTNNPRSCKPTLGRVEVCNAVYPPSAGWLGLAQFWINRGGHITKGDVKLNDGYFQSGSPYNTAAWRQMVMCQEIGHTLGLDHQDEDFFNANLGTCMDYTANPDGPPSNLQPNSHDYEQLVIIYTHLDPSTTVGAAAPQPGQGQSDEGGDTPAQWGVPVRARPDGRPHLYRRDLGAGNAIFTWVTWADRPGPPPQAPAGR